MQALLSTLASARRVVVTNASEFAYSLPAAYRPKILAIPHVVAASAFVYFGGVYRAPSDQLGVAVDPDQAELMWPDWGVTPARGVEFRANPMACLVPAPMLLKYGWHVGQQIILKGTALPVDVTLRIADTLGDKSPPDALLFRRDYLDDLLQNPGRVNAYHVMVDRKEMVPAVVAAIDETLSNSPAPTRTESEATFFETFVSMDTLFLMLKAVAAAVTLAVSLVAMNTVLMAVRERVRETAVMRAIGFGPIAVVALTVRGIFDSRARGRRSRVLGDVRDRKDSACSSSSLRPDRLDRNHPAERDSSGVRAVAADRDVGRHNTCDQFGAPKCGRCGARGGLSGTHPEASTVRLHHKICQCARSSNSRLLDICLFSTVVSKISDAQDRR